VSTSAQTLPAGTLVAGRYEILRHLGDSAPGKVYLAIQHPLEREVAVKLIESDPAEPRIVAQFSREAAALARLSHPACSEVIDYGAWAGRLFLVLRFVPGVELTHELDHRWPPFEALTLAIDLAEGLAHAHAQGVVHRNLAPPQVILSRERGDRRSARLVDFGLAHLESREFDTTAGRQPVGTPGYMAPERIQGAPGDERTDVYAVGLVLFEMLTASHPFMRDRPADTMSAQSSGRVPRLDEVRPPLDLPECVVEVVDRATRIAIQERFRDGRELALALRGARLAVLDPALRDVAIGVVDGATQLPPALLERIDDPTPGGAPARSATPDPPAAAASPSRGTSGCLIAAAVASLLLALSAVTITAAVIVAWLITTG
jgi:serine/threonine-protein kinase